MKRFSNDVAGTRLLNAIVFLGAVAILVASLTGPFVKVASNPAHPAAGAFVSGQES